MATDTPLLDFVATIARLVEVHGGDEAALLPPARAAMARLVARDGWLPEACARPHPQYYQQHLLYGDPLDRFSVVSFVWGPGQKTPVHDHTVWGLIGMLRGAEVARGYAPQPGGLRALAAERLEAGDVAAVSPTLGDVHQVANAHADRVSISIHCYGGNIGRIHRHVYTEDGQARPFVSGYSEAPLPNLWARSAA